MIQGESSMHQICGYCYVSPLPPLFPKGETGLFRREAPLCCRNSYCFYRISNMNPLFPPTRKRGGERWRKWWPSDRKSIFNFGGGYVVRIWLLVSCTVRTKMKAGLEHLFQNQYLKMYWLYRGTCLAWNKCSFPAIFRFCSSWQDKWLESVWKLIMLIKETIEHILSGINSAIVSAQTVWTIG